MTDHFVLARCDDSEALYVNGELDSDPKGDRFGAHNLCAYIDGGPWDADAFRAAMHDPESFADPIRFSLLDVDLAGDWPARLEDLLPPPQPAWHDKPTCPGLWVCEGPHGLRGVVRMEQAVPQSILSGRRYYGPIPEGG